MAPPLKKQCIRKPNSGNDMNVIRNNGLVTNNMEVDMSHLDGANLEEYFNSYEDIDIHRLLLSDDARTNAYKDAIFQNRHLFEGKTVMDVGAGTGILSLFMAKAGAKKVYAIEASKMAKHIPAIARANGYQDVIQVIHSEVEKVSLPPDVKMDVLVSEWMGFYLLHESMLPSVIFARDKFLVEGGIVFPSETRLYACPCSTENLYQEEIQFWDNVHGFNFSPLKAEALKAKRNKPTITVVKSQDFLSDPVLIKTFDINYVTLEDIKDFVCRSFVGITKTGNYQGLCLWFECDFYGIKYDEEGREIGCTVTLSTSPYSPETHWKQTLFVFGRDSGLANGAIASSSSENVDEYVVEEDEVVGWSLKFAQDSNNPRFYNMEVELLDAETEEHPIPCSCPMARCVIIKKMIEKEDEEVENMDEDL